MATAVKRKKKSNYKFEGETTFLFFLHGAASDKGLFDSLPQLAIELQLEKAVVASER